MEKNKNTKLKSTGNKILDDLIKKMLTFDEDKRINWTQYFEHEFFKTDFSSSQFNLNCYNHPSSDCKYYCTDCKKKICPNCKEKCEKSEHRVIEMYKIGFNENEEKEMNNLITDINNNIEQLKQLKNNISTYFKKMKTKKENITTYDSDPNNNYKKLLMNNLKEIKENTVIEGVEKNFKKIVNLFPSNFFDTNFKHISSIPRKTFILSIASFPSNKLVAVLDDKSIEIYDKQFSILQSIPNAHSDLIRYVSVKDEEHFATCSNDSSIKTWIKIREDFYKVDKVIPNAHEKSSVIKVKYRENNDLISCSWDNSVKIWVLEKGSYKNIKKLEHKDAINCIFVAPDINTLISSGVDGTKLWKLNDYKEICYIQDTYCHGKNTLNRLDNDRFIIGGRRDGNIKVISVKKRAVEKDINNEFQCFCICVSTDEKNFLIGGKNTVINVYSCSDYEFKYSVEDLHHNYVRGIINLNDGSIASYSDDKTIQIYKLVEQKNN